MIVTFNDLDKLLRKKSTIMDTTQPTTSQPQNLKKEIL
jgi:hypothetical protein